MNGIASASAVNVTLNVRHSKYFNLEGKVPQVHGIASASTSRGYISLVIASASISRGYLSLVVDCGVQQPFQLRTLLVDSLGVSPQSVRLLTRPMQSPYCPQEQPPGFL